MKTTTNQTPIILQDEMIDYDPMYRCEICWANQDEDKSTFTPDVIISTPHCQELLRNRISREKKNYKTKETVF